jgi:hypothetical protein
VEIAAGLSPTGQRSRMYFSTRDEAKEYASQLREANVEHGKNASAIRPSLADEATRASELLAPFGLSLMDAARAAVEREILKSSSVSVDAALAAFLLAKEGRSESQINAYSQMREAFSDSFGSRILSTLEGN